MVLRIIVSLVFFLSVVIFAGILISNTLYVADHGLPNALLLYSFIGCYFFVKAYKIFVYSLIKHLLLLRDESSIEMTL